MVLTVLQAITNSIIRLGQVCSSLGVIENYTSQYMVGVGSGCEVQLVTMVLDNVVVALADQQEEIMEGDVHKMAIMSLNWGAFAKAVDSLQRILLWVL